MLRTTVQTTEFPAEKRVIVISDVHGKFDYFTGLLEKLQFSDDDILVLNGDIIERGGQSLQCLRLLMQLVEEKRAYYICGNNDAFVWQLAHEPEKLGIVERFCRSRKSILTEMCREMNLPEEMPVEEWIPLVCEQYKKEFEFIISAPTILETPHFTFVHAGLRDPDIYSEKNANAFDLMKFDDFLAYPISFKKPVVVGHWPTVLYSTNCFDSAAYVEMNRNIISIDGGCTIKTDGQLNAMVLSDGAEAAYSFEYYDSFPKKRALDDQAEANASVLFRWPDCRVEVLESGEYTSLVRHVSSGVVLRVFNEKMWKSDSKWYCDDTSDGLLEINSGDIVSVVIETPEGALVKKGTKTTAYYGRLAEI